MKILIIDDDEYKYKNIFNSLNRILDTPDIKRAKSRNGGLFAIYVSEKNNNPFEFIVCDNYMPLNDDEYKIEPFAEDIINEIRRITTNKIICTCSSGDVEKWDYNYFIKYNPSILMDEQFKMIFLDMLKYKQTNLNEKILKKDRRNKDSDN